MLRVAEHAHRTDTGRQRPANEDAYYAREPLFAVADGMGGAQAGEVASHTAVEVFRQGLPDGPGSAEERLAALVAEANARIHELAQGDEQRAGMGTTLTAAYLGPEDLAVAHVGDSRLYCLRDGRLEQRTDDHSLVGELVRRGQLSAEEAEEHPQRSIITRALGPEGEVVVDHHTWPARDGDVFLICSDGLSGMVSDASMAEIVSAAPTLRDAAAGLIRAANDAGGRDNITVILFRVEDVAHARDGAGAGEQDTGTFETAPAAPTDAHAAAAPTRPHASSAAPPVQRRDPKPPTQAIPAVRRRRRVPGFVKFGIVLLILLSMVGSGAWIASRGVFFVGADRQGFVTLYRGLPYELPAGIHLYSAEFQTGVPVSALAPRVRSTIVAHKLRSEGDAVDLVRRIERGELVAQR